jgi:large subunit ribosomal protein L30
MASKLKITLVKSVIGYEKSQGATVRSLGLLRIRHTVVQEDCPVIRGMLHKVRHLVVVEPVQE